MSCEHHYDEIINKYIDGEATDQEKQMLESHMTSCPHCQRYVLELQKTIAFIQSASHIQAPSDFTMGVMAKLPKRKKTATWKKWVRKHPLAVAAAVFIILMSSSVFSLWMTEGEQVTVAGSGNLQIDRESGRVVVPEGEVIEGNLVVRNGELHVEGEVKGNVLLVNSEPYMASAGHVSGEIDEVNQILDWIWYHMKQFFSDVVAVFDTDEQ
ncbi:anti-sigma-W factor RsiW [Halalkalibacterium ligniniphilum]|uniref:anti-sigma-W factor RsiW n=1 Tax=Halalkalibacterium ligniniphilum TaxID=1134413 RepID=UPI00034BE8B4|nr:anti-sigma-W factor RsiW [Halalkalibacterium ligniniphilum]